MLAKELGIDPAELRRRNFIPPDVFPYKAPGGDIYDSGNYKEALEHALRLCDYAALREEQARQRTQGRYMGIGLCSWVKTGGAGPSSIDPSRSAFEWGRVRVGQNAKVIIYTGASPHGQGLATTFSQIVSETLGIHTDNITMLHGDTEVVTHGVGTFGSRSMAVGGPAVHSAALKIRAKMLRIAAHILKTSTEEVLFEGSIFTIIGRPGAQVTVEEVLKAAYRHGARPDDVEFGLDENSFFQPTGLTFNFGTYVAVVEVDPETGEVELRNLYCVDDQGVVVNPTIVEGQVHGGATQGLGQALYENIIYDQEGQLTTGSLMDYAVPIAEMVPTFVTERMETPSPINALGVKGMGEGPSVGTPPAVVNAVVDALEPFGVRHIEMPLTPERVWRAIQESRTS